MFDAATIKALVGGGGGAVIPIVMMYGFFTQEDDFARHVAESNRGFILDTVARAQAEEPGDYKDSLCRSLQEAISELCASSPQDSMCLDRQTLLEKATCS